MGNRQGELFAVWGNTPAMQKRKMYKLGVFKTVDGNEIPYGYIENDKGIQYSGELYSLLERDPRWRKA